MQGAEFRKVDLTGTNRQGVLTQASVLTMSSYSNRTSPVLRGKWVLDNILSTPPPSKPAGVPDLDETAVGVSASLREQLQAHRANAVCASCHSRMDPLGFALGDRVVESRAAGVQQNHRQRFVRHIRPRG